MRGVCACVAEGVVPGRASPLAGALRGALLGASEARDVRDASLGALALLRALHALSRHWHTLYRAACLPDLRPLVPNNEFINAKVRPIPPGLAPSSLTFTLSNRFVSCSSPLRPIGNFRTLSS